MSVRREWNTLRAFHGTFRRCHGFFGSLLSPEFSNCFEHALTQGRRHGVDLVLRQFAVTVLVETTEQFL
jgi:hypothetical protein